jgi:hypothetical protein
MVPELIKISKSIAIFIIALVAISTVLMAKSANAQTIPKPSVPEFTIKMVGPSFEIPPTYSFNPNTGLFDANDGYHIQYSTIKIVIKNQPFSNQTNYDYFYYNVRIKPHNYSDSYWHELFYAGVDGYPIQTQSDCTVIPLSVEGSQVNWGIIPTSETTDIQVEAMIGHIGRNNTMFPYPYPYVFFGETSGWSNTQTVTLPEKVPIASDFTPNPSSTLPNMGPTSPPNTNSDLTVTLTFIIIGILVITVVSLLLYVRHLKKYMSKN